jgi:hypothetical protein
LEFWRETSGHGSQAICTIAEGDYHYGLAAFINSLIASGYAGNIFVGTRGNPPEWLSQCKNNGQNCSYKTGSITIDVFVIDSDRHLTNYKPIFMQKIFLENEEIQYLWFMDPDICINFKWWFFEKWSTRGIALCEEIVRRGLSENNPLRLLWKEIGEANGLQCKRLFPGYYNGGLLGVGRGQIEFLSLWKKIIDIAAASGRNLQSFAESEVEHPFSMADQDALNMAVMFSDDAISTLGPEGMGFIPGWNAMFHAVGVKPWRTSFIRAALGGFPPTRAMKVYIEHSNGPLRAYSKNRYWWLKFSSKVGAFIGRIYRRS